MEKYVNIRAVGGLLYENDAITFKGLQLLSEMPAAKVREDVIAQWTNPVKQADGTYYAKCSNCSTLVHVDDLSMIYFGQKFCHWCGALMEKKL